MGPTCGAPLAPDALPRPTLLRCPVGHSADLARQGYVSLLRGRHATSGDTAAMVQAREELLGSGHYRPIQDAVAAAVPADARLVVDLDGPDAGGGAGGEDPHLVAARGGALPQRPRHHRA